MLQWLQLPPAQPATDRLAISLVSTEQDDLRQRCTDDRFRPGEDTSRGRATLDECYTDEHYHADGPSTIRTELDVD